MTILLVISTLGVVVLVFFVMLRLDNFLGKGGILDGPQGRANQGVLLYGAPDAKEKICRMGLKCTTLTMLSFPEDGFYSALLALSRDDNGNIALCHAAKRSDPGIVIIARCNAPEQRGVYEAVGVNRLLDAGEPIDGLLTELWGINR
jgi:hypothetical protein